MPVGDGGDIAVGRGEIADAQSGHGDLGEAGDVERPLGREGGDRRRPVLDQRAEHVVLDDGDVVLAGDRGDRAARRFAHQGRGRVDHRGLHENRADVGFRAGLVQRVGDQAVLVDGEALEMEAEIGGERDQRVVADRLGRGGGAGRRGAHQRDGHAAVAPLVRLTLSGETVDAARSSAIRPRPRGGGERPRWAGRTRPRSPAAFSASQPSASFSSSRCIGSQTGFRIDRSMISPSRCGR